MKPIMRFSGCFVFIFSFSIVHGLKILEVNYYRFYAKYWQLLDIFLHNNNIHTLVVRF